MTPNLLVDDFALALTHIGLVLDSFKDLVPEYPLGLKVRRVETYKTFTWVTIGKICGFDYLEYPDCDNEWYYHIAVEKSIIIFNDGTTKFDTFNKLDTTSGNNIELID